MNSEDILEFRNISKTYSGVKALDGVSFSIRKGETHALCGENGAGKSTLIKTLTGAIQPTDGEIIFKGEKITGNSPAHSMALGIRAIYQEFTLIPYLSVADNLFYGREPVRRGIRDIRFIREQTRAFFDEMGVDIDPDKKVRDLGIAEQQILEILKAVSSKADLYIMDEPTASLTVKETGTFFNIIEKMKKSGATIIFISHRLEEVFELCDRVTVLCDGRKTLTDDTANLDRDKLISAMVGRELTGTYPRPAFHSEEEILRVEHLNNQSVKDVSFVVHKGEILGIGGLVGAGRTEVARALFGADKCSAAKIELNGRVYTPVSPQHALLCGLGLIPEDRKNQGLILGMSIRDNTTMGCLKTKLSRMLVIDGKKETELVDGKVSELKVKTPSIHQLAQNLSGGNQQKVVLAKMMAMDCDVLIFDEPTRGIDVGAKAEIYELMRKIADEGKGIIMISSDMPELIGMSDRMIVMHEGRIRGELQRESYTQERILEMASE